MVIGVNDAKPYSQITDRAWTFRSISYGHDAKSFQDLISALRMVGYDYVISLEHEDAMMSVAEGQAKSISLLKEASISESAGLLFWA